MMIDTCIKDNGVAVVTLRNPPLNLLTQEMRREIGDFFLAAASNADIRALVLSHGDASPNGKVHFCAGADIKEHSLRRDRVTAREHCLNGHRMAQAVLNCGKPVIAAIEGACLGGGFELALACDFRVASSTAKIALPEIQRGLFPGTGGIALLSRLVGPSTARQVVFGAPPLSGQEAFDIGAVERVCFTGNALSVATDWAAELAALPAKALQAARRLLDGDFSSDFATYLAREVEEYIESYQTEDSTEGREAFLSKRDPVWKHR